MLSNHASRVSTPAFMPVVPGLYVLRNVFVNLYYVAAVPEQPLGPWVLVDAGLAGSASTIRRHAAATFGPDNPPAAIVLTHAHFDHAGALGVLLAGDAFTTVVAESGLATLTQRQVVHGPPAYFTPDWDAARASVRHLADLAPEVAATGHGIAMHGEELRRHLRTLGEYFDQLARPKAGRYVPEPALADASGVRAVPPPRVNPWVVGLAAAGAAVGLGALLLSGNKRRRRKKI